MLDAALPDSQLALFTSDFFGGPGQEDLTKLGELPTLQVSGYLLSWVRRMDRQPTKERKRQIAQAALKIIAEQGLGKFTTSAIAREVGLSEGALFRHFKSKDEIVLAVIDAIEDELTQGFPPPGDDPLERLGTLIRQRLDFLSKNPCFVRLIFSDQLAQASGEEGVRRIRAIQTGTMDFIRRCLKQARKSGQIRDDLSVDELTVIVFGAVFGAANRELYENTIPKAAARNMSKRLWPTLETLIRR
ncbi:MAG: TetR/AcrR family transcriptional regulator [Deltaproteobacteria bacterium]|nr:TetR/AcrR family transcriptional regulator [Deltaproteobacteria bacterium]